MCHCVVFGALDFIPYTVRCTNLQEQIQYFTFLHICANLKKKKTCVLHSHVHLRVFSVVYSKRTLHTEYNTIHFTYSTINKRLFKVVSKGAYWCFCLGFLFTFQVYNYSVILWRLLTAQFITILRNDCTCYHTITT